MSLRTRLIIAFLLLSVVPLSVVTFFTYRSWVTTFETAAQREASQSATDIGRRMERITAEVGRRMDRLFVAPPFQDAAARPSAMRERIAPMLGDAAALVERVEFHPAMTPDAHPSPARVGVSGELPPSPPAPPEMGRRGRGRARPSGPPPPYAQPPPAPQVIVVDVQQAIEDAKRLAREEMAAAAPELAPLVEESLTAALPAAEAALKAVSEAAARSADVQAAAHEMQMQVEGRRVEIAVKQDGKVVGKANATLNLDRTLRTVFAFARRDQGEIPFAIDTRGALHNPDPAQRRTLESFGVAALGPAAAADGRPRRVGDWLVVARKDPGGLIFGIARPIGESLRDIRRAAIRNLSLGLLVIGLAIVGIVPISHRMTRHLTSLQAGVRQLAAGDFRARVPVRSNDEFGSLAQSFNQMAEDLERHESLVVEQERLRRELELSRLIQTEMLPRMPLRLGGAEIRGVSIPAREVGGDFFNYFPLPDGRLALLVGDVSGKGVSAALLMANVQATLRARIPLEDNLATLAAALDREIDETTPGAVYLTLFLGILDTERHTLRYVNAGHNPQFVLHADDGIVAMPATGLPIALYPGQPYQETVVSVRSGDLIFFYTDGLVDTENERGEMFGAARLNAMLAQEHSQGIDTVLERVEDAVRQFRGNTEPFDDATMMALRVNP